VDHPGLEQKLMAYDVSLCWHLAQGLAKKLGKAHGLPSLVFKD
jgi:hypothetical protein